MIGEAVIASSAIEAEARAAIAAMELAKKLRIRSVIFESDSKMLVQSINSRRCSSRILTSIVARFRALRSLFYSVSWIWIPRKANAAADHVAKLACKRKCPESWIKRSPSSFVFVLNNDGLPCPPATI